MATQLACDFTFFERTPEEMRAGETLTVDNIQNIQNLLALAATEKLNIEDNPLNPHLSALQRAKLDGEIGAYRTLIISSQAAVKETYDIATAAAKLQQQQAEIQSAYAQFTSKKDSNASGSSAAPSNQIFPS